MDSQTINLSSEFDNATTLEELAQQLDSFASNLRSKHEDGWRIKDSINSGQMTIYKEEAQSASS